MSSLLKYLKYLLPRSHPESLFTLYRYISRLSRIIVLCVYFVHRCMSFSPFSFDHYVVLLRYTDSDYHFGIFQLFFVLLTIMLSVLLWFMDSDYLFGIFQLFFVLLAIMLSVLLWFMDSDYLFGIFILFLSHILHISKSIITHIIACSYFFF